MSFKLKKPYTGVNAEGYEMAPSNITPLVTIYQLLNSFLSNSASYQTCRMVYVGMERCSWGSGTVWAAKNRGHHGLPRLRVGRMGTGDWGAAQHSVCMGWEAWPTTKKRMENEKKTGLNLKQKCVDHWLYWGNYPEEPWQSNYSM